MFSIKEILQKILGLLGAFEQRAQFVIMITVAAMCFMFYYFDEELEKCKEDQNKDRERYETHARLFVLQLKKADENTINEIRNCQIELIA
ncbi:MAG: hypothetical protein IPO78_17420 [Saprospiraceae bacterium]|nr:hypothetical protein [Saprospiraceae bacterium]